MVGKSGDKMILAVKLRRKINTRKKTGPICDRNGLSKSGVRTAARRLLFTKLFLSVTVRYPRGDRQLTSIWCDDGAIRAFVPPSPHREAIEKLPHWCRSGVCRLRTREL